jgi:hypothetical protein
MIYLTHPSIGHRVLHEIPENCETSSWQLATEWAPAQGIGERTQLAWVHDVACSLPSLLRLSPDRRVVIQRSRACRGWPMFGVPGRPSRARSPSVSTGIPSRERYRWSSGRPYAGPGVATLRLPIEP